MLSQYANINLYVLKKPKYALNSNKQQLLTRYIEKFTQSENY